LAAGLAAFGVEDLHWGTAYDIGRYEAGFSLLAAPPSQGIEPGGVARYALRLYPPDLPFDVGLVAASPSPSLTLRLDPASIGGDVTATLTITDSHFEPTLLPGVWYTVPITGTGAGFVRSTSVGLLVGGTRVYLPLISRD
jgi:hypothetical protein